MRVERWLEDDDDAWDALCARHDEVFQTTAATGAYRVFGAETRRIRVLDDDGTPHAAVAILEVGSRRFPVADRVFARRFQIAGGALALSDSPRVGELALAGVEAFAAERGAVETDWKPTWPDAAANPHFAEGGWDARRFGVAWRPLPEDPEAVAGTLSQGHRTAARQALREGMTVRDAEGSAEVRALVDASFARSGVVPRNPDFLDELYRGLDERGAARALVVDDAEGPASALLGARCGGAVFVLFQGRADRPTRGASNLLHLELMRRAVAEGVRRLHDTDGGLADGSGEPVREGITKFKRLMGCRVDPCERGSRVHRPVSRRVGRMAFEVYGLIRGGGTRDAD